MKYLVGLFILVLPLACSNESDSTNTNDYVAAESLDLETSATTFDDFTTSNQTIEQKLIKESYLSFETQNIEETYRDIAVVVKKYKGYIQDDSANKNYNRLNRRLTIRIPTVNFDNTIDGISEKVAYFDIKRMSSKDVTEEFIDLEARIKAKKTLESRYLELLKKANSVKEILEIERELSSIREDIEAKEGRLKYLQNKVSLSTIEVEFYKLTAESKVTKSYASKMWSAIVSGFNSLSVFFIGILYIWPFILLLIIAFFFIRKRVLKQNKK